MGQKEAAEKELKGILMKNLKNFCIWQFYGLMKKENK